MRSLTALQIEKLKLRLEDQKTALQSALPTEALYFDDVIELRGLDVDAGDRASDAQRVETKRAIARHLGLQLDEVERALNRLYTPSYGACIDCLDAIGIARLTAHPSAERCERCQEVYEHTHGAQLHPSM